MGQRKERREERERGKGIAGGRVVNKWALWEMKSVRGGDKLGLGEREEKISKTDEREDAGEKKRATTSGGPEGSRKRRLVGPAKQEKGSALEGVGKTEIT